LSYQSPDAFAEFNKAVAQLPYIMECHLVSGDADYLIKARINDMSEYRALLGDMLLTLPGVKNSKSYIVMEEVKETQSIPLQFNKK
jgi:Lrp/AsnC family leucine-responsive transcriptional regulator